VHPWLYSQQMAPSNLQVIIHCVKMLWFGRKIADLEAANEKQSEGVCTVR
jgi:hypothetical protein